ncbi:MAG: hypothetical protein AAF229_11695 [Pseudomonadota bacterium]
MVTSRATDFRISSARRPPHHTSPVGNIVNRDAVPGFNFDTGFGFINAERAVDAADDFDDFLEDDDDDD